MPGVPSGSDRAPPDTQRRQCVLAAPILEIGEGEEREFAGFALIGEIELEVLLEGILGIVEPAAVGVGLGQGQACVEGSRSRELNALAIGLGGILLVVQFR